MSTPPGQQSEEELLAAYEAQLSRITSAELILHTAASLLSIGGRRLGSIGDRPAGGGGSTAAQERDLEQVRDAIDGVRALLPILERGAPQELRPLRDALSQLQMAYARESRADSGADRTAEQAQPAGKQDAPAGKDPPAAPGPAESSGKLWVPGR